MEKKFWLSLPPKDRLETFQEKMKDWIDLKRFVEEHRSELYPDESKNK